MLLHDFFDIKKPKIKEDSWHGGGDEPKDAWHSEAGVVEGLPGEFIGGTAGGVGGAVVGAAVGGPMGALVGGAAGGTAGQIAGRELTDEQKLNEFGPLLVAGARLFMAAAPKIAQVFGKVGQAGARGVGQAAKAGAGIAAKNAGQIGIGVGAYEIGSSVADIVKDITAEVGAAVDEKTIFDLATLAFKYAIPAGIVLAILYGGKKAIDSLFADPKTTKGVVEGSLEANTPNPVVVIQDLNGKILDTVNLSVAVQKYKLGNPQDIKNQLAHQAFTTIGNYIIASPMAGQPQDKTTKGVVEGGMPSAVSKRKQQYGDMSDKAFAELHQSTADNDLVAMAWRHGYGKGSLHYVNKRKRGKQGVAEGEIAEVNDEWFKQGAFKTFKKAAPVKYQLAQQPGTVDTLEGPVRYEAGHYIMTGPKGERYPISPDKFNTLYDDNGDGTATPKKISKLAKLADHDGVLHTSWGDLQYTKGNDYIVRHGTGDYGAVKKDIFAQTYDNLGQGVAEVSDTMHRYGQKIRQRVKAARDAESNKEKPEEPQAPIGISTRDLLRQLRKPTKLPQGSDFATDRRKKRLASGDRMDEEGVAEGESNREMWEASDPSGMMHVARHYNKSFIITAKLAEGGTKKYRIHAQSERVAREKFSQHYNMAKVLSVEEEGMAEGMFTKGPAIDPVIGKQINNIINRLWIHAKQTKDDYLRGAAQELFDILKNTGGTYSVPGSPGIRDVAEDEMADFIAGGGKITQVPFKPPRKGERLGGSRHIGGGGDTPTSRHKGISANTQGNKVIGLTKRVAETKADYRIKSIGHDAKGDYYISPSTGKKVYRKAKVGDHENPKTGEHKGVSEGANYWTKLQDTRSKKINSLVDELEKSIQ